MFDDSLQVFIISVVSLLVALALMPQQDFYVISLRQIRKAVIKHIREHLVAVTGKKKYARLPVICGTYAKDSRMRSQRVVDALYKLAQEDKNFYVVDASDLPLLRDRLHFNAQGAQELGQRIFEKMKELRGFWG